MDSAGIRYEGGLLKRELGLTAPPEDLIPLQEDEAEVNLIPPTPDQEAMLERQKEEAEPKLTKFVNETIDDIHARGGVSPILTPDAFTHH